MNVTAIITELEKRSTEARKVMDTATVEPIRRFWEGTANGLDIATRLLRDSLADDAS